MESDPSLNSKREQIEIKEKKWKKKKEKMSVVACTVHVTQKLWFIMSIVKSLLTVI